eukprot:jgi/Phyca11/105412/e_gw1.11.781.1
MEGAVMKQHAHQNTVFHCLYGFYCLGYTNQELAKVYNKSEKTIRNWIKDYDETGTYERDQCSNSRRFAASHLQWLCDFYAARPLAYLDVAQAAFKRAYRIEISKASVWRIIHECGLTRKVFERRSMHIKEQDIFLFVEELSDFQRKPRVSILAFIGVRGALGYYDAQGTFDRVEFVKCCKDFAYSADGNVRQDPEIVHFLRSIGIKAFQRYYVESSKRDLLPFVVETFQRFKDIRMERIFEHCGWKVQGDFDPSGPM